MSISTCTARSERVKLKGSRQHPSVRATRTQTSTPLWNRGCLPDWRGRHHGAYMKPGAAKRSSGSMPDRFSARRVMNAVSRHIHPNLPSLSESLHPPKQPMFPPGCLPLWFLWRQDRGQYPSSWGWPLSPSAVTVIIKEEAVRYKTVY